MGGKKLDLAGQRRGKLIAISYHGKIKKRSHWKCICDCGQESIVEATSFNSGRTQSCGCSHIESARRNGRLTKGPKPKHGLAKIPEYFIWKTMRQRCINPKNNSYQWYGAIGIKFCDRWNKFQNFIDDMGRRPSDNHSIDRINPYGDYEPSNCRWATLTEQANNKRKS